MAFVFQARRGSSRPTAVRALSLSLALGLLTAAGCAPAVSRRSVSSIPDPRVGLRAGKFDAAEAAWNMRVVSETKPSEKFAGITNSDISFSGPYAIQGNYNGYQIWDISNPSAPTLKTAYVCPASQSDVSVYKNLLFVSGEGTGARIDCGTEPV